MRPSRISATVVRRLQHQSSLTQPAIRRTTTSPQCVRQQTRTFIRRPRPSSRAVENLNLNRMQRQSYDYYVHRRNFMAAGALAGVISFVYTSYLIYKELQKPTKLDSIPSNVDPFSTEAGTKRKTVIHDKDGRELVPTGNSTVPAFPRTLNLAIGANDGLESKNGVEYTLVGLGMRTVSFLGIQVYLVGYYVATPDIASIQSRLVKHVNPIATTLVPSEREELKRLLLDPVEGEKLWREILQDVKPRSVFRIVPVRDTDFHHLRDGFVRAIQARSQSNPQEFGDEDFATAMKDFRTLFNRGKVPKRGELLMVQDESGALSVVYDDGKNGELSMIGRVQDARIGRALWLNYLAGSKVASEAARKNIVDGIMEFVERPVGTVATQVL